MSPIPADLDPTVLQRLLARLSEAGLGDLTLDEARRLAEGGSIDGSTAGNADGSVGGSAAGTPDEATVGSPAGSASGADGASTPWW